MKFNSGSSIKNNAYSSSSASSNTTEKLKKLNEELDQLELLVANMQAGLSGLNAKVGVDSVANQIESAKTEINNSISQSVTTQEIKAESGEIDSLKSNVITVDRLISELGGNITIDNIKSNSIFMAPSSEIGPNNQIDIGGNGILFIFPSTLILNVDGSRSIIINSSNDLEYYYNNSDFAIHPKTHTIYYSTVGTSNIFINDYSSAVPWKDMKSGVTIEGPLYADLAEANFQNINVSDTITTDTITAENATITNIASNTAEIDNLEAESAKVNELNATEITSDRINSSQIHTKIDKENIGYTIIPEHQDTELYAIAVPITNGIWEIEIEGKLKATISKVNAAVEVVYWRNTQDSLPYIGVKEDVLYLYTRDSGKVYFSNNTLEVNDTTISTYGPTSPEYPILENLDYKFDIITKQGIVNTETTYIKNLIVTGSTTIEETTADDIYVVENNTDGEFYPTFVDSNNEDSEPEDLYTNNKISVNPNEGSLSVSKVKTPNLEYYDDQVTINAGIWDSGSNKLTLMAEGENDSAIITLLGKRNNDAEITMGTNVSIDNNLTVNNAEKVSNKFYVGPTLSSADLAQLADNALVIMGE